MLLVRENRQQHGEARLLAWLYLGVFKNVGLPSLMRFDSAFTDKFYKQQKLQL